jgi:hypothetical protein
MFAVTIVNLNYFCFMEDSIKRFNNGLFGISGGLNLGLIVICLGLSFENNEVDYVTVLMSIILILFLGLTLYFLEYKTIVLKITIANRYKLPIYSYGVILNLTVLAILGKDYGLGLNVNMSLKFILICNIISALITGFWIYKVSKNIKVSDVESTDNELN